MTQGMPFLIAILATIGVTALLVGVLRRINKRAQERTDGGGATLAVDGGRSKHDDAADGGGDGGGD